MAHRRRGSQWPLALHLCITTKSASASFNAASSGMTNAFLGISKPSWLMIDSWVAPNFGENCYSMNWTTGNLSYPNSRNGMAEGLRHCLQWSLFMLQSYYDRGMVWMIYSVYTDTIYWCFWLKKTTDQNGKTVFRSLWQKALQLFNAMPKIKARRDSRDSRADTKYGRPNYPKPLL